MPQMSGLWQSQIASRASPYICTGQGNDEKSVNSPLFFARNCFCGLGGGRKRCSETNRISRLFLARHMENLSEFHWIKRPVLVFADSEDEPPHNQAQMGALREQPVELG